MLTVQIMFRFKHLLLCLVTLLGLFLQRTVRLVKCFPLMVLELFLGLLADLPPPRQHLLNILLLLAAVEVVETRVDSIQVEVEALVGC
jgi:hypothetical protein